MSGTRCRRSTRTGDRLPRRSRGCGGRSASSPTLGWTQNTLDICSMKPTRHLRAIEQDYDACRPRFVELVRQNRADLGRLARIAQFAKLGELNTIAGSEFGHVYDSASLFNPMDGWRSAEPTVDLVLRERAYKGILTATCHRSSREAFLKGFCVLPDRREGPLPDSQRRSRIGPTQPPRPPEEGLRSVHLGQGASLQ